MELKIISLNIWDLPLWFVKHRKERVQAIAKYIKQIDADIVCLQESFDPQNRLFLHEAIGKDKYHVSGDLNRSRRLLFFKLFDVTGGLVVFSKFPIKESKFVPYNRFLTSALGEFLAKKGFLETLIETPRGLLRVVNTHLHEETPFVIDHWIRLDQVAHIFKVSDHGSMPALLTGDFNEQHLRHQDKFSKLFEQYGFAHPHRLEDDKELPSYRPENPYVDNWINRTKSPKRYDYILLKDIARLGLRVKQYGPEHVNPPLSDHDPILLTLMSGE